MHHNQHIIQFYKMHGLGNDFAVINATTQPIDIKPFISQLAHRHLGIGFDQLLLIEPSKIADFACRIFNANGSEAEQCGNGLRCVGRFIRDEGLSAKPNLLIETKAGIFDVAILGENLFQVEMGVPCFELERVPFLASFSQAGKGIEHLIDTKSQSGLRVAVLSMGNPHAIMEVTSVTDFPVAEIGEQIANHSAFPQSTNVGFMEIIDRQQIHLRTFERGVGETFACGSNACAAVVAGIMQNNLEQRVKVILPFGELQIEWLNENEPVKMTGPATLVFQGTITL